MGRALITRRGGGESIETYALLDVEKGIDNMSITKPSSYSATWTKNASGTYSFSYKTSGQAGAYALINIPSGYKGFYGTISDKSGYYFDFYANASESSNSEPNGIYFMGLYGNSDVNKFAYYNENSIEGTTTGTQIAIRPVSKSGTTAMITISKLYLIKEVKKWTT